MLHHLRKLRPLISPSVEYRLRRAACVTIPHSRPATDHLFHACTWKTGSQWVRLVLSDPRFFRATGLRPHYGPHLVPKPPATATRPMPTSSVITSLMIDYPTFDALDKSDDWKAFFVLRDPRDLVVSRYHSARFSHRETEELIEVRRSMESMSDEEGLLYTIDHRFEPLATIIRSWMDAIENPAIARRVRIVRFEDITGEDNVEHWHQLMNDLDLNVPEPTLASLMRFYRASRLRPSGKKAGGKDQKYRSGKHREWRKHFTDAVDRRFDEVYGSLARRLGYED